MKEEILIAEKASQESTDFGFQQVAKNEKQLLVANVFNSVATKYDLMNDLLSFGIHRHWKKFTLAHSNIQKGQRVLDLAGGTGDFTAKLSPLVGENGQVVLADINPSMLVVAQEKLGDLPVLNNIAYQQANAEALPFEENSFDRIIIGFGLRNVTDKNKALRSMLRVLKPGGQLSVLEFSHPCRRSLASAYHFYSFHILPHLGQMIAHDAASYRYLAESIRMHPTQDVLKKMMLQAGFKNVHYKNLSGGIVALHTGEK